MTNATPKYLKEIREVIDTVPYGEVAFSVRRINNVTVEVSHHAVETVKRPNTEEYLKDIIIVLQSLARDGHTGKVTLELEYKQGNINTLGYLTQTKKEYRK